MTNSNAEKWQHYMSRKVGALQISISIIIKKCITSTNNKHIKTNKKDTASAIS